LFSKAKAGVSNTQSISKDDQNSNTHRGSSSKPKHEEVVEMEVAGGLVNNSSIEKGSFPHNISMIAAVELQDPSVGVTAEDGESRGDTSSLPYMEMKRPQTKQQRIKTPLNNDLHDSMKQNRSGLAESGRLPNPKNSNNLNSASIKATKKGPVKVFSSPRIAGVKSNNLSSYKNAPFAKTRANSK